MKKVLVAALVAVATLAAPATAQQIVTNNNNSATGGAGGAGGGGGNASSGSSSVSSPVVTTTVSPTVTTTSTANGAVTSANSNSTGDVSNKPVTLGLSATQVGAANPAGDCKVSTAWAANVFIFGGGKTVVEYDPSCQAFAMGLRAVATKLFCKKIAEQYPSGEAGCLADAAQPAAAAVAPQKSAEAAPAHVAAAPAATPTELYCRHVAAEYQGGEAGCLADKVQRKAVLAGIE